MWKGILFLFPTLISLFSFVNCKLMDWFLFFFGCCRWLFMRVESPFWCLETTFQPSLRTRRPSLVLQTAFHGPNINILHCQLFPRTPRPQMQTQIHKFKTKKQNVPVFHVGFDSSFYKLKQKVLRNVHGKQFWATFNQFAPSFLSARALWFCI